MKESEIAERAYLARACKETRDNLPNIVLDMTRMALAGLLTPEILSQVRHSSSTITIEIEREDLVKWRKIGHLSATYKSFDKTDADGVNWIRVTVEVQFLTAIQIRYRRQLPASCSCKVTDEISTYKTLTCNT